MRCSRRLGCLVLLGSLLLVPGMVRRRLPGATIGFFPIDDHAAALREDIELLATKPFLQKLITIAGFIYDVESGEIDDLVRWERN